MLLPCWEGAFDPGVLGVPVVVADIVEVVVHASRTCVAAPEDGGDRRWGCSWDAHGERCCGWGALVVYIARGLLGRCGSEEECHLVGD